MAAAVQFVLFQDRGGKINLWCRGFRNLGGNGKGYLIFGELEA